VPAKSIASLIKVRKKRDLYIPKIALMIEKEDARVYLIRRYMILREG